MKIPVFYHMPKCGGTYILYLYQYLNKEHEKKQRSSDNWTNQVCRKISVYLDDTRYFDATGIIEIKNLLKLNCELESYKNFFSIDKMYELIDEHKVKITSIFIQPTGDGNMLDSRVKIDKLIKHIGKEPSYFTIIRDVFDRLYSEYSYLTSETGKHEPYSKIYRNYENFEDFLIRFNDYSNIITRQIAMKELNNNSFEDIKYFFNNFTVGTMQNLKETAIGIWQDCYRSSADCTNQSFFKNANINKKPLTIKEISNKAKKHFLAKTEWDRKLYAYLSQI